MQKLSASQRRSGNSGISNKVEAKFIWAHISIENTLECLLLEYYCRLIFSKFFLNCFLYVWETSLLEHISSENIILIQVDIFFSSKLSLVLCIISVVGFFRRRKKRDMLRKWMRRLCNWFGLRWYHTDL